MNTPALPTLRLVAAPETDASRKPARLAALAQAGSRGDSGDPLDPLLSTVIVAAPTAEARAVWSTSQSRIPDSGAEPTITTRGMRARTASASGVMRLVKPAP